MTICERMYSLLESTNGKNAAGLAAALGIGTNQTTYWKKQKSDPPAKFLAPISEYLGVSVSFLVTGEDEQVDLSKALIPEEVALIERYRSLDTEGKEVVRVTALQEHRRVLSDRGTEAAHVG